ncbi:MAG: DUF3142 domain-containing protein [Pyrinomonadaceae bacterium]
MKIYLLLFIGLIVAAFFLRWASSNLPRVLDPREIPVAFWTWGNRTPNSEEVERAISTDRAKTFFIQAGQIDYKGDGLTMIRPTKGDFPTQLEVHLVYNATPSFLNKLEDVEPEVFGQFVANAFLSELSSKNADFISGLQLDLDIPTRLLPRYADLLRHTRANLPTEKRLSITGLATWLSSNDLGSVLGEVDFWAPQFYGYEIPKDPTRMLPISSIEQIRVDVAAARSFGKPFYAGLAAYGMALHYSRTNALVEIRGNIPLGKALKYDALQLVESGSLSRDGGAAERYYTFKANYDVVIDGLTISSGEKLAFIQPSSSSLRNAANAVRTFAGDKLVGICIFRFPLSIDETTLSLSEIAASLQDRPTTVEIKSVAENIGPGRFSLSIQDRGTASSLIARDAFVLELPVSSPGLTQVESYSGFDSVEPMCSIGDRIVPCSERRADILRFRASYWRPGSTASVEIRSVGGEYQIADGAIVSIKVDDGTEVVRPIKFETTQLLSGSR